jgi:hypothetical protein
MDYTMLCTLYDTLMLYDLLEAFNPELKHSKLYLFVTAILFLQGR